MFSLSDNKLVFQAQAGEPRPLHPAEHAVLNHVYVARSAHRSSAPEAELPKVQAAHVMCLHCMLYLVECVAFQAVTAGSGPLCGMQDPHRLHTECMTLQREPKGLTMAVALESGSLRGDCAGCCAAGAAHRRRDDPLPLQACGEARMQQICPIFACHTALLRLCLRLASCLIGAINMLPGETASHAFIDGD